MPVRLVPVSSGSTIKLDKPVLLIGRNPDCDVVLKTSRKVSRTHCVVACSDNRIIVRDLGSTNGVWVNSHRVEREARLSLGDEVSFADVRFQLLKVERSDGEENAPERESPDAQKPAPVKMSPDRAHPRRANVGPVEVGDNPVPIPEEEDSFLVEASAARLPKLNPELIARNDEVSEDDSAPAAPFAGPQSPESQPALPILDESSNDVIPLAMPEALDLDESEDHVQYFGHDSEDGIDSDSDIERPIIPLDD